MSPTLTPVRPHVYADPDGNEWRCVEGVMQSRERDDEQPDGMEVEFSASSWSSRDWRRFLGAYAKVSLDAFDAALADPMTAEWAEEDDCRIQEARERAGQPTMPVGADRY